jgi:hypothetical protein
MGKGFDRRVRTFLLRTFEGGGTASGGIEELTAQKVIKNIILPAYASIELPEETELKAVTESGDISEDIEPPISRVTAAAYLAFLYLSDIAGKDKSNVFGLEMKRSLKEHGVIVPVNMARETKQSLKWVSHDCRRLKISATGAPSREIHLGVEFKESATCQLTKLPISTALRQQYWTIVDPLVACFIFSDKKHDLVEGLDGRASSLVHEDVCSVFGTIIPEKELNNWKAFLSALGVVDFFGIYNVGTEANRSMKAPHLIGLLEHLVRHGVPVCSQQKKEVKEITTELKVTGVNSVEEAMYVPVYLPSIVLRPVLSISQDVHFSLQVRWFFVSLRAAEMHCTTQHNISLDHLLLHNYLI